MKINKKDIVAIFATIIAILVIFASIGYTRYYKIYMGELYGLNWWPRILIVSIMLTIVVPIILRRISNDGIALFTMVVLSIIGPIATVVAIHAEAYAGIVKFFDSHFFNDAPFAYILACMFGAILIPATYFIVSCFFFSITDRIAKVLK